MSEHEGTPRSLRISFEFEVPRNLKGVNISGSSVQKALDTMADRIIGLSENLFPWAGSVAVRKQWVYNWTDHEETIQLPANNKNTPK